VFAPGGELTVAAYVKGAVAGETLTLTLPPGLTLIGDKEVLPIPPSQPDGDPLASLVTWRVRSAADTQADYRLQVRSSTGLSQARTVTIQANREFE
jgi:hypothetical protein